jgi:Protein of unknown function (DUF2934)
MPPASRRPAEEDRRVRERAQKMWREAGRPSGGADAYLDEAKTLVAIEDNPKAGQESIKEGYNQPGPWGEPVEEAKIALENEGEFPTMTDQGEQENPHPPRGRQSSVRGQEESTMTGNSGIGMEERIRARAYQLWVEEGRPHGREHEHWERAKRLIEEDERESKSSKAPASPAPAPADTLTAVIDPPYKTKTAVKKKRSFKSAKA